ncbi:RNA-binding cell elongation regulator Jag/EloR [Desulfovibrio legallii]|uniref:RNA-binding protein KhpB n=1 Tax=Desulfovibrio legallii TaxID=571438 RepID=A0A6H3F9Z4_9BACT|nr:RNA-binding cell elongation regulator Jag/EloR [Desulfovibrio legallii]TBH78595.1 protein jag [Desulfovibrio legallii]
MDGFKEFQGKDLDDAIREACEYFNAAREKLEIEIVEDAKSGIFGIVGARKAKVRARRVELHDAVASILGADETTADAGRKSRETARETSRHAGREGSGAAGGRRNGGKPAAAASPAAPVAAGGPAGDEASPEAEALAARNGAAPNRGREANKAASCRQPEAADGGAEAMGQERRRNAPPARDARAAREARPAEAPRNGESGEAPQGRRRNGRKGEPPAGQQASGPAAFDAVPAGEGLEEDLADAGLPSTPLEQLDLVRLEALTREAVGNLVRPIVGGEAKVDVRVDEGRVFVGVDCDADPGLLIGREGQTLAALQYMVSRIVSRGMDAAVRVQLDAGAYRQRQEEKLREMALALAEKVRQSGRSLSTRPLSSYHRRVVHVCLQELPDVQTRSSGEGPLKRVVIMRRKGEKA